MAVRALTPEEQAEADYAFDNSPPSLVPAHGWKNEERRLELERDAARAKRSMWRWIILGFLLLTAILGWAFRWQFALLESHGEYAAPAVLMVNRWTGELRWVQGGISLPVEHEK